MLHVLKNELFIRGGGGGGVEVGEGRGPLFLNFLDPPLRTIPFLNMCAVSRAIKCNLFKDASRLVKLLHQVQMKSTKK